MFQRILTREEYRLARVVIFGIVFMLLPTLLDMAVTSTKNLQTQLHINYYETAPVSDFYENMGVISSDVCYGDIEQMTLTERYARQTETGWKAEAIKELFRNNDDGSVSLLPEYTTERPFYVEASKNGISTRQIIMPILEPGHYHWEINVTKLYLAHDVVREDVPPIITNIFEVKNCNL